MKHSLDELPGPAFQTFGSVERGLDVHPGLDLHRGLDVPNGLDVHRSQSLGRVNWVQAVCSRVEPVEPCGNHNWLCC